jgi:hypothetical protein
MSIKLNDNIKINAGKPSESKYLSTGNTAYLSINEVNSQIAISERYLGLTVLIDSGATNIEHWYKEGVSDTDLIEKKFSSEQPTGDFVTGATNLGYFSGQTGIQKLNLLGFPTTPVDFNGYYYSEYNWYYSDADGIIRIGSPTYNGPLRRAYVDATRTKSWIYDVGTSAWILSNNDVSANVGNSIVDYGYDGSGYTETEWSGFTTNGSTSIDAEGSLTTGDTLTIGNPVFATKSNQNLNLRTIINDTPDFLNITSDENYIHFSGVSSVLSASNYGTGIGVYSGTTDNHLKFRTLVQSGDTSITQQSDGSIIIYSSSDGSADAITGVTNLGVGATVYTGTTNRNIQLRTFVGSGSTIITESGDSIIVGSTGGGTVFTEDITVSIASGKTFGKYENGDIIPASGKTPNQVILMSLAEALEPTVNLSSSSTDVEFGESGKTVDVTFSYTINTLGAGAASAILEWRRGNTGSWVTLNSDTGDTSYFHYIDDSANRFNTDVINYRYTVVDTEGASKQVTHDVTPQAYAAPSMSLTLNGSVTSPETQNIREKGNVTGGISSGSIDGNNRPLVRITDWILERRYDGGSWTTLASDTGLSALSISIPSTSDNTIPTSATTVDYRITYTDEYTTGNGGAQAITFKYYSFYGYNTSTSLTSSQIQALANKKFLSSQVMTDTFTAFELEYTYYSYPSTYDDITSIILDGVTPILGAFIKISKVNVTNSYGESLIYKVYKSNSPGAFTDNEVAFS